MVIAYAVTTFLNIVLESVLGKMDIRQQTRSRENVTIATVERFLVLSVNRQKMAPLFYTLSIYIFVLLSLSCLKSLLRY